jgi:hypothetical protein
VPFGGLSGGVPLTPPAAPPPQSSGASSVAISPTLQPPTGYSLPWDTNATTNAWMYFTLSGVKSPGTIPRGGVKGFKRETGWDEKAGKGTQGATLTLKSKPPVKGSITIQLITTQDFTDWDAFVTAVLSIPSSNQQADGLSIFYPQFSSIGLTTVVVKHYTGPEEVKPGLYNATMEFIEWSPPPSTSIVATVASTAPDQDNTPNAPPPEDPRITQLKTQISAASQAASP